MMPLLEFDERMLRDIGLSRSDVVACLNFAEPEDLFEERARRQAENIASVPESEMRRAA
jgi:hypothetical protein